MRWQEWLNTRDGVAVDVDGAFGAQCWDSWADYAINVHGANAGATYTGAGGSGGHAPGYACMVYHNFWTSPLGQWFTPVDASQPAQRGDVAFWDYGSTYYPWSHVAVVVEDRGGSLWCMTQNPGPNHYGDLTKAGLLGYLRPDNQSVFDDAPAPAPAPAPAGRTREIVSGDTLWQIATEEYGDGTRYMEIFNASTFRSGNPNLIFPGEIAVIP